MAERRNLRALERRRSLLEVAAQLFMSKGYDGVSIDEIIVRAGGTKTAIYKYFGGKSDLFREVVDNLSAEHAPSVPEIRGADPDDYLRATGRHVLGQLLSANSIKLHRMVVGAKQSSASRMVFHRMHEVVIKQLGAQIGEALGPAEGARLARIFVSMVGGEQLLHQLVAGAAPPPPRDLGRRVEEAVELLGAAGALSGRKQKARR